MITDHETGSAAEVDDLDMEFDATGYLDTSLLPAGRYSVKIVGHRLRDNSKGTGRNLGIELEVVDGPSAGWTLFDWLTWDNPSTQAVEIARERLASICTAVDLPRIRSIRELYGAQLSAKVDVEPTSHGQPARNRIVSYGRSTPAADPDAQG